MTRKRAWKDAEGRIVKKRPNVQGTNLTSANESDQTNPPAAPPFPLSPPGSASSGAITSPNRTFSSDQGYSEHLQEPSVATGTVQPFAIESQDPFWESIPFLSDPGFSTGPFDDIFMPDTASSFNMPYTTMTNYNWLFNLSMDQTQNIDSSLEMDQNHNQVPQAIMQQPQGHGDNVERITNNQNQHIINAQAQLTRPRTHENHTSHGRSDPHSTPLQESPMCLLDPERSLPMIDDLSRERMLDIVETCRPIFPDGKFRRAALHTVR